MISPFHDRMGKKLSWKTALLKIEFRIYSYFLELETGVLWYIVGAIPFHTVRRFFYSLAGLSLGENSTIHMFGRFYEPRGIVIGDGTIIGDQVVLDGRAPLKIGNHVDIASRVMILNAEHDIHSEDFSMTLGEVVIGDYVFIGPNVVILPGVHIGKGAVIAAGAVVVKDVAEMTVVGGVPAKEIGKRKAKQLTYKLGRFRLFQ